MTFTFFLREESGAGRHICVFLPPRISAFLFSLPPWLMLGQESGGQDPSLRLSGF